MPKQIDTEKGNGLNLSASLADSVARTSETTEKLAKSRTPRKKETGRVNNQKPMMTITCRVTPEEYKAIDDISRNQDVPMSRVGRELVVASMAKPNIEKDVKVAASFPVNAAVMEATTRVGDLEARRIESAKIDLLAQSFYDLDDDYKAKFIAKIMMNLSWTG
jgi:hypothetical protein